MTREVVTVPASMPVVALARLMAERGISSTPVMGSEGRLLGIVTEADLLRRLPGREDAPVGWWRGLFQNADRQAEQYARTHGVRAEDVMTTDLVTVGPDATAAHCAHLMEERRIKRLPVVEGGRLVGIVSRADLVRAVQDAPLRIGAGPKALDARIRAALRAELRAQPWTSSLYISAEVIDAVVTLHGFVDSDAVRRGLRVLAERIDGVARVDDRMEDASLLMPGSVI